MMKKMIFGVVAGVLVLIMISPILYVVLHSLKGTALVVSAYSSGTYSIWQKLIMKPFYVNLDAYYEALFRTPQLLYMFWNTVFIVAPIVFLQVLIAFLAAYGFSQLKFLGSETLFFIYIIIMLMPFQVTLVPNYIMLNKLELLDTKWALILPGIFNTFSVFFLKQFMEGIEGSFLEEARLLGASEWQVLSYVIMPMCKPIIMSVIVFIFIDYWSMVEQPVVFMKSEAHYPLSAYLGTLNESKLGISFASSVLYMVLPICLVLYAGEDLSDGFKMTHLK